jgi:hypothetical protein
MNHPANIIYIYHIRVWLICVRDKSKADDEKNGNHGLTRYHDVVSGWIGVRSGKRAVVHSRSLSIIILLFSDIYMCVCVCVYYI